VTDKFSSCSIIGHLNNFEVEGEGRYQKHCEWCGALILFSVRVKIIKEVRLDSDPVEVKAYEKRIRSSDYEEN